MKERDRKKFTYDAGFQERIVRTMYQDPDWCIQFAVPHLNPALFDNGIHRWLASAIVTYARKFLSGITRDALKIEAKNAYNAGRLVKSRDASAVNAILKKLRRPVADRSFIKRELFKFIKTQTLKDVLMYDAVTLLKNNDADKIDSILQRVLDVQSPTESGLGHFMAADRGDRFKRRQKWVPDGIATGLENDRHMKHGGPRRKQVAAIVAPPHVGKTTALCHIARQAVELSNKRVLFITLEEDAEIIQDRLDSAFTGIDINEIETARNSRKIRRFWKRFKNNHDHEMIVIKEFPMNATTTAQIETYIKSLERRGFYPDVVVIDYAGLLRTNSSHSGDDDESRHEEIGTIFVELRSMAQRFNLLVWTAHQGNRASMNKRVVTMKDLAESFKPAMHADVLLAICQTTEEENKKIARLFSMKVRGGQARKEFKIKLDYARVRIINR